MTGSLIPRSVLVPPPSLKSLIILRQQRQLKLTNHQKILIQGKNINSYIKRTLVKKNNNNIIFKSENYQTKILGILILIKSIGILKSEQSFKFKFCLKSIMLNIDVQV